MCLVVSQPLLKNTTETVAGQVVCASSESGFGSWGLVPPPIYLEYHLSDRCGWLVVTWETVTSTKKGRKLLVSLPFYFYVWMVYSFIKVKEDWPAICPSESILVLLPSGYVNSGFCETIVIFVLQVCFIYKTFLEKKSSRHGWIRTTDLRIRSALFWSAELRAHKRPLGLCIVERHERCGTYERVGTSSAHERSIRPNLSDVNPPCGRFFPRWFLHGEFWRVLRILEVPYGREYLLRHYPQRIFRHQLSIAQKRQPVVE